MLARGSAAGCCALGCGQAGCPAAQQLPPEPDCNGHLRWQWRAWGNIRVHVPPRVAREESSMPIMRSVLLAISENRWMRAHGQRLWFVRRAVSAFMPGEELEDMLRAAGTQAPHNIGTVFTRLGESVTEWSEADFVMRHYLDAMERCRSAGVGSEPSVKPTQLGLDMDAERCHQNLRALAERARQLNSYLWIDMEQTAYVDATLEIVRRLQAEFGNVGVCLQAYLYRTLDDIAALRPLGVGVRLVKGA